MCAEIEINGKQIETIGELAELIGKDNIVILEDIYTQPRGKLLEPELCLCPVDMERTASKAGYSTYQPTTNEEILYFGNKWEKVKE